MRYLNKKEFDKLNKEIDFQDLFAGMKVTLDGTDEPGWYEVISSNLNDWIAVEKIETVDFREVRDLMCYLEDDLNDLVSNIKYHIGDIETLGTEVLKRDELFNLINDYIEVNLERLKDILKADYFKNMGLNNKEKE